MRYGLLFERFLNPARKDLPDMDIDFSVAGRDRVINYVAEKYGRDRVAQIITFSTMAARAAIRDAGRVLDIRTASSTASRSSSPRARADSRGGAQAGSGAPPDRGLRPRREEVVELARPLEGLTRADSIHAAGVVIGAQPLIEVVPLQQKDRTRRSSRRSGCTTWSTSACSRWTSSAPQPRRHRQAVELIGGIDIGSLPLDDMKTYEMLARGESTGVFQFESSGMRDALRQVKPTEFEDLIALVALYRRGRCSTSRRTPPASTAASP